LFKEFLNVANEEKFTILGGKQKQNNRNLQQLYLLNFNRHKIRKRLLRRYDR